MYHCWKYYLTGHYLVLKSLFQLHFLMPVISQDCYINIWYILRLSLQESSDLCTFSYMYTHFQNCSLYIQNLFYIYPPCAIINCHVYSHKCTLINALSSTLLCSHWLSRTFVLRLTFICSCWLSWTPDFHILSYSRQLLCTLIGSHTRSYSHQHSCTPVDPRVLLTVVHTHWLLLHLWTRVLPPTLVHSIKSCVFSLTHIHTFWLLLTLINSLYTCALINVLPHSYSPVGSPTLSYSHQLSSIPTDLCALIDSHVLSLTVVHTHWLLLHLCTSTNNHAFPLTLDCVLSLTQMHCHRLLLHLCTSIDSHALSFI